MKVLSYLIAMMFLLVSPSFAEEIVFSGIPVVKISEGGAERTVDKLDTKISEEFRGTIIKKNDTY